MAATDEEPFWRGHVRQMFAALGYRNYRLWFIGQLVSLMGTWMQMTAQGFLVYELTHSTAYLGYVAFAAGIPSWLFMLYAGVVADRVSRRRLMLVTQSCMMGLALVLAGLTFTHLVQAWHIVGLAFLLGVANAFDAPARQAFVAELVERADLTNAIAMNSSMFNLATAVGPAVAGLIYALLGPAWCFVINALSFVSILIALALIRLDDPPAARRGRSVLSELADGVRFVVAEPTVRILMALVVVLSVFGLSFVTLIPAWAVGILGGDATTNGFMHSARGVGALSGALFIALLGRFNYRGRLLTLASFGFPLSLLVFSVVRGEALSLTVLVVTGVALMVMLNLCNALVQTQTPDALRGRVMAIYSLSFFGFMPIGGLLAGAAAEHLGAPLTVIGGAAVVLAFALSTRIFVPRLHGLQ